MNLSMVAIFAFLLALTAFGSEGAVCSSAENAKALVKCAIENHPQVLRAQKSLHQARQKTEWAGQWSNPELDGRAMFGRSLGDQLFNAEVSLRQPIPLGGTISSRVDQSEAEVEKADAALLSAKERAAVLTVQQLYRSQQIELEIEIADETIGTFDKILKQYRSKVKLSPEQRASFNVFELVRSDFILRRANFLRERQRIAEFFETSTGLDLAQIAKLCPRKLIWPVVVLQEYRKGSAFQLPAADLKIAQMSHEVAKSVSWPTLKMGPSFGYHLEGGVRYPTYGFSLMMEIPFFSLNGGHRSYTRAGIARAQGNIELRTRELDIRAKRLRQNYQTVVSALKRASSTSSMTEKHHRLEKLFVQGLISSSLVIEAHRQMLDYVVNKHVQERAALKLLWTLYALRGSIFEESP